MTPVSSITMRSKTRRQRKLRILTCVEAFLTNFEDTLLDKTTVREGLPNSALELMRQPPESSC